MREDTNTKARGHEGKDSPILFSGKMVRAILEGSKTMTRRTRGMNGLNKSPNDYILLENRGKVLGVGKDQTDKELKCPYGKVGDRLWVRETFAFDSCWNDVNPNSVPQCVATTLDGVRYSADANGDIDMLGFNKWRPSIHMPRWASRITLEITGVRAERLQEITEGDARAEGFESIADFHALWSELNGADSWGSNPWVWVVCFKTLEVRK